MKPKLRSLHGIDQNRSWFHFTGINSEEISHNRIREEGYYLVCFPGRLTLTDSSSWELTPIGSPAVGISWQWVDPNSCNSHCVSPPPSPDHCSAPSLSSANRQCSHLRQPCLSWSSVTDRSATSPNLKIFFMGVQFWSIGEHLWEMCYHLPTIDLTFSVVEKLFSWSRKASPSSMSMKHNSQTVNEMKPKS